ncbi:unnamed protein product [Rotaria sp. Silwood1]|nr:unnamed protein product [Rotaria sp. Silwood1]CAF4859705.1 unnamed protein product [Rotaria sp. Silwood1]CAF4889953.1 unnamed protein product [Rotaria sp. Silwood1]CAF5000389.1 unnamed protein product [Rotaria sp. Silwood1]
MVGFDANNKHVLDTKFLCSVCSLILKDPIQLTCCGHRQCQSCYELQYKTTIQCSQCFTKTSQCQVMIDRGFKMNMQSLPIECCFCNWIGCLSNYQEHLDQIHRNPKCEYCHEQCDSVENLNEHQVLKCEKIIVNCLLKDFGCYEQIRRYNLSNHYCSEPHRNSLRKILLQMKLQIESVRKASTQIGTDNVRSTIVVPVDVDTALFQELCEILDILSHNINILNNDEQAQLNNVLLQCQTKFPTLTLNFLRSKLSVQQSNNDSNESTINYEIIKESLTSLKKTIENLQHISQDGTFIWKVTHVREQIVEAKSERQISISSPPFYSSPNGYKMRARLYLNGNGDAHRTHMSLFFVLMRGLNDPILKFPFNYTVTFCLYDQTPAKRHIIDSFRPDINSSSFQRPRSEMNIGSGIPKFCPLATIQHEDNAYVRDDTMFIKIRVDFGETHKTLLPYAVSLNPGLPTHIQQAMIKEEAERRSKQ